MRKFKFMTLHANESEKKVEAKGISQRRYKNNYYQYDAQYGWGANTNVLYTFLQGEFVDKSNLSQAGSSSQYILILNGVPFHAVVFTGYNNSIFYYYDPQNNVNGSCSLSGVLQVYMATSYYYLW